MIKFEINGQTIEAEPGSMIIEAADKADIYIPRFCYHKKLSVVANCRMCLVDVEKAPKTLPACATPISEGMKVFTKSPAVIEAQKYVMEFLLINHPLDCPICDQGGECELQDLSMGFGESYSHYSETKRSVHDEDIGPLVATDLTRCIHCTRCIRFGQEIAGVPELGMLNRGEKSQIAAFVKHSLSSELVGNIIDLCPVGALTSKPFRFKARAWELEQSPSIAPHDCVGSHVYVHSINNQVKRVVPKVNEAINETWMSDRDRFSYTGLAHDDRLKNAWIKHQGDWQAVDWTKAFEYAAKGLQEIIRAEGASEVAALVSPSVSCEEGYLLQKIMRQLGCENIDYRTQQIDFRDDRTVNSAPLCQSRIAELATCDSVFLLGSNIRREQPLLSTRLRSLVHNDGKIFVLNPLRVDFNFPVSAERMTHPDNIVDELAAIAKALGATNHPDIPSKIKASLENCALGSELTPLVKGLKNASKTVIVLGALALNHPLASEIRALARVIAVCIGANVMELTPGANSQGLHRVGVIPKKSNALNAKQMFENPRKAYILYGIEPDYDCVNPALVQSALSQAGFVIAFSAYQSDALKAYADVILPIVPWTETSGTLLNVEYESQYFSSIVKTTSDARPGWKVLRVFANMLGLEDFQYARHEEISEEIKPLLKPEPSVSEPIFDTELTFSQKANRLCRIAEWPLYRIDSIVRRAEPLQQCKSHEGLQLKIHSNLAKQKGLGLGGDRVRVKQHDAHLVLPLIIDDRIPEGCVYLANAFAETAKLGAGYADIILEKE